MVKHAAHTLLKGQHRLHHPFDGGNITTGLYVQVGGSNRRRTIGGHLHHVLRVGKGFQGTFTDGVEHQNRHLAPRHLMQRTHHTWVVSAGVMPNRYHQLTLIKVFQGHGALADTDGARQPDTGGLVAQVRAVGKVVGAQPPGEQLEQVGRLVRSTTGRVELHLGWVKAAQHFTNALKRGFPRHGLEGV